MDEDLTLSGVYTYTCIQPLCIIPTQIYTFSKGADYWKGKEWKSDWAHKRSQGDIIMGGLWSKTGQKEGEDKMLCSSPLVFRTLVRKLASNGGGSGICFAYNNRWLPLYRNNVQLYCSHLQKGAMAECAIWTFDTFSFSKKFSGSAEISQDDDPPCPRGFVKMKLMNPKS